MKLTELRIGNWITDLDALENRHEIQVEHLDPDAEHTAKPIPLTEEWLRDFGFEKEMRATDKGENNYGESGLRLEPTGGWMNTREREKIVVFPDWQGKQVIIGRTRMRYVHELQNLFFALTKEELVLAATPK